MNTITLQFQLEWTTEQLSPAEHDPEIRVFFDSRLVRDPVVIKHSKYVETYAIEGKINSNHKTIPSNLHIGIAAFAWRKNSSGALCLLDIGTNHLQLSDIASELKMYGKFEHKMPLLMRTTTPVDPKEYITIRVAKKQLKMGDLEFSRDKINAQLVGDHINSYVQACLNVETQMTDTINGTSRIRVPSYIGEAGLEMTQGVPLPAVAFALSETPKTNPEFWLNAMKNTMKRDGLLIEDWDRLNVDGQCRATINMITQLTQAFDYVSDTVDKNKRNDPNGYSENNVVGIEQFSNSLTTGSGDCEDGGASEKDCHTAFVTLDLSKKRSADYRIIKESQLLARQYIPPLSLDAVNGAAVADDVQHIGAHMNDNFIPIHLFQKWLKNSGREGRKICRQLPWPKYEIRDDIPFIIGEGTGPYDALGYHDPYAEAVGYVHQIRDVNRLRTEIKHERGKTTNFFIGSLEGLTDYFINRGHNVGSFLYCTKQANGALTRGALYDDMINRPERVALVMHEKIPRPLVECMKDATSIRVPPEPLVLSVGEHVNPVTNPHLEYIKTRVNAMNRSATGTTAKVNVYVRDYQLDASMAQRIVADIDQLKSVVSVDYYQEKYTDKFYGYNMQIECKFGN